MLRLDCQVRHLWLRLSSDTYIQNSKARTPPRRQAVYGGKYLWPVSPRFLAAHTDRRTPHIFTPILCEPAALRGGTRRVMRD